MSSSRTPVVIVEDNEDHRSAITAHLKRFGFTVRPFDAGGDPMLYRTRASYPEFQICIVDYELQGDYASGARDGLELMNQFWEADRHLLFVLFTGVDSPSVLRQAGANAPLYETVSKQISSLSDPIPKEALDELVESIRRLQRLMMRSLPTPEERGLPAGCLDPGNEVRPTGR